MWLLFDEIYYIPIYNIYKYIEVYGGGMNGMNVNNGSTSTFQDM